MAAVHNRTSLANDPPTSSDPLPVAKRGRNLSHEPMLNDFQSFPGQSSTVPHTSPSPYLYPSHPHHQQSSPHVPHTTNISSAPAQSSVHHPSEALPIAHPADHQLHRSNHSAAQQNPAHLPHPPAPTALSHHQQQPLSQSSPLQHQSLPPSSLPPASHTRLQQVQQQHRNQAQPQQRPHLPLPLNQPQSIDRHSSLPSQTTQHQQQTYCSALPGNQSNHNAQSPAVSQSAAKVNSQHVTGQPVQPLSLPQLHHQPPHLFHQPSPPIPYSQQQSHASPPHQSLQPLLQNPSHSGLLPGLSQTHFKHTDEVDVADDLMNLAGLPSSSRPQDMQAALVSSTFPHDQIPSVQVPSVIDSILPDAEQDPLNMGVNISMPISLESQRAIERQVLVPSDPESSSRPPIAPHPLLNQHTSPSLQNNPPPFSLQVPQPLAHLSYGAQPATMPHPQVIIQGTSSLSAFPMSLPGRNSIDSQSHLVLGRNATRGGSQQAGLLLNQVDEAHRRGLTSTQISIQDLTKPKAEPIDAATHDGQFSPASPSFSAVTISPTTLVQTSQPQSAPPLVNASVTSGTNGGESPTSVATPQGLSCPICKSVFTRRYNLKVHMSSKHSARRDYRCQDCPTAFNRVDSLKRHIATTHRGEKKWTCTYCNRNFGQRPHMKMHIDTVHLKKRDHKCHCGKAFGTRYNLTAHQRTHEQTPKKHVCTVCKKSFALKSSLARHQRNSSHTNADVAAVVVPGMPSVQN